MLEDWCQKKLSKEVVIYGIRRYLRGAWLSLHVDKLPTHIISVILQVHQTKLYSLSEVHTYSGPRKNEVEEL